MIAIVTDSNSQIPPELAATLGIVVVPLTVTVDGVAYREGVDIDADDFYARFETGTPAVSTSQPSPGAFAAAYQALADSGADAIVSVHIGSSISGTVNSARLAAAGVARTRPHRRHRLRLLRHRLRRLGGGGGGRRRRHRRRGGRRRRAGERPGGQRLRGGRPRPGPGRRPAGGGRRRRPPPASTIPVLTLAGGAMRDRGPRRRPRPGGRRSWPTTCGRAGRRCGWGSASPTRAPCPWWRPWRPACGTRPRSSSSSATGSAPASAPTPARGRRGRCSTRPRR